VKIISAAAIVQRVTICRRGAGALARAITARAFR
jgi:hypothetical protein